MHIIRLDTAEYDDGRRVDWVSPHTRLCFLLKRLYSDYDKANFLYSPAHRRAPYLHVYLHLVERNVRHPPRGEHINIAFLFVLKPAWLKGLTGPE